MLFCYNAVIITCFGRSPYWFNSYYDSFIHIFIIWLYRSLKFDTNFSWIILYAENIPSRLFWMFRLLWNNIRLCSDRIKIIDINMNKYVLCMFEQKNVHQFENNSFQAKSKNKSLISSSFVRCMSSRIWFKKLQS